MVLHGSRQRMFQDDSFPALVLRHSLLLALGATQRLDALIFRRTFYVTTRVARTGLAAAAQMRFDAFAWTEELRAGNRTTLLSLSFHKKQAYCAEGEKKSLAIHGREFGHALLPTSTK